MIYEENDYYRRRGFVTHESLVRANFVINSNFKTQFSNPFKKSFFDTINYTLTNNLRKLDEESYIYKKNKIISDDLLNILSFLKQKKIISSYYFRNSFNDDVNLYKFSIDVNKESYVSDGRPFFNLSLGSSSEYNANLGVSKSIGEFLERYSLSMYSEKDLVPGSVTIFKKKNSYYLDPKEISIRKNISRKSTFYFNDNTDFLWVSATDLDKRKCLIPAQAIFWTYNRKHQNFKEPIIREPNTNGGAGHFDLNNAIISGIYEIIERDAFLRFWLTSTPPRKIVDYLSDDLLYISQNAEKLNFILDWYYTGNELGIPSVICVIKDKTGFGPAVSMGGSSKSNLREAMINSYTEAQGLYTSMRDEGLYKKTKPEDLFNKDVGRLDRLRVWGNMNVLQNLSFFEGGSTILFDEIDKNSFYPESSEEELKILRQKIEGPIGRAKILYYEKKSELLSALGFKVVKVVISNMLNLYLRESYKPNFIPSNLSPRLTDNTLLNNIPHPFP